MPQEPVNDAGPGAHGTAALESTQVAGLNLVIDPTALPCAVARRLAGQEVVTVLAAHVTSLNHSGEARFREAFNQADFAHADGISMTIISALQGRTVKKLATTDLAPLIVDEISTRLGRTVRLAVIGGVPGVARAAGERLAEELDVELVLALDGYPDDWDEVIRTTGHHDPDVVLLGIGMPREAYWCAQHLQDLPPGTVVITCGGWLRLLAGVEERAPALAQRLQLEWAYRIITDPRRTARRYLIGLGRLAYHSGRGLLHRFRHPAPPQGNTLSRR